MEINKLLEHRLWNFSPGNPIDIHAGTEILKYLIERLSDFLQIQLAPVKEYLSEPIVDGFCENFRGTILSNNVLFFTCGITLGMQFIGDDFIPHTSANLYLFDNHHRLITDKKQTYIYLEYVRGENEIGQWINRGWQEDEFWEYENIEETDFF